MGKYFVNNGELCYQNESGKETLTADHAAELLNRQLAMITKTIKERMEIAKSIQNYSNKIGVQSAAINEVKTLLAQIHCEYERKSNFEVLNHVEQSNKEQIEEWLAK